MALYTKTGDTGTTSLYGGKRLSKADMQINAYGSIDELTTILGMCIVHISEGEDARFIEDIQRDLYVLMGYLAGAPTDLAKQKDKIAVFEKKIDILTSKLPELKNFIIPGGTIASSWAHIARVCCRRTERVVVDYLQREKRMQDVSSQVILMYLNRLSDLLFAYAREFNKEKDTLSKNI